MQVCRRGHEITNMASTHPERCAAFCDKCGSATVTACEHCQQSVRGYYRTGGIAGYGPSRPSFCHGCGKPYPWTDEQLSSANALVSELDELDEPEKRQLNESIAAVMQDTPSTLLGATRIKKIIHKVGKPAGELIYKVVMDLATDTAAKMLKGQ
jgi:hypothetical protein